MYGIIITGVGAEVSGTYRTLTPINWIFLITPATNKGNLPYKPIPPESYPMTDMIAQTLTSGAIEPSLVAPGALMALFIS